MLASKNVMFSALKNCEIVYRCTKCWSSSALFVTGDKASETYAVLTPHLDYEQRFKDVVRLKRNVELRGLSINVDSLRVLLEMYKDVNGHKIILEKCRAEVVSKMKSLKSNGGTEEENAQKERKYRLEGKLIRDDLKALMRGLWDLEGNVMLKVLSLPNDLHPDTPDIEPIIFYESKTMLERNKAASHLQIGQQMNILKYENETSYFLSGDAALFELGALYFYENLFQEAQFAQLSNADFGKSVIIEGIGINHKDAGESFILKSDDEIVNNDDRLHLVGGASLASFCAFHAKQTIKPHSLPVKYFTIGRHYDPRRDSPAKEGLFNVWQASALEMFIATSTFDNMMLEFESALKILISAYEQLQCHFRVAFLPARDLKHWESLRASIQMYSTHSQCYVEVGNVCISGDFVSKRLLTSYQETEKSESKFVNVVSGTALCVPRLLACILEQSPMADRMSIPEPIGRYMLGM